MEALKLAQLCEASQAPNLELRQAIADYAESIGLLSVGQIIPPFEISLDAAMTQLPEGWPVRDLSQWNGGFAGRWTVALDWPGRKYSQVDAEAATAALALCAAALRARSQTSD